MVGNVLHYILSNKNHDIFVRSLSLQKTVSISLYYMWFVA